MVSESGINLGIQAYTCRRNHSDIQDAQEGGIPESLRTYPRRGHANSLQRLASRHTEQDPPSGGSLAAETDLQSVDTAGSREAHQWYA
jgi:hypothetical protein